MRKVSNNPEIPKFIDKYGNLSISLAQLFGFTRAIISYPAGVLGINIFKFILYTTIGGIIFCTFAVLGSVFITKLFINLLTSIFFWILLAGCGAGGFIYFYYRKKLLK